jgi:hypothetical protein
MITDISKVGNVVSVTQGTNQPINYFGAKGGYYFNGTTLHLSINKDEYQVAFANLTVGGVAPADVAAAKTALSTVFPDTNSGTGGTGLTVGGTYDNNAAAVTGEGGTGKFYKSSTSINGSPIVLITV